MGAYDAKQRIFPPKLLCVSFLLLRRLNARRDYSTVNAAGVLLTSSTLMAVVTPPAFWKAQGKLSSPAPSADLSMMNTAPNEPSLGGCEWDADRANRLMLSRASSSMTPNRETRCYTEGKLGLISCSSTVSVN